jgi:hypothetical protein
MSNIRDFNLDFKKNKIVKELIQNADIKEINSNKVN